jgi:hypothetical protein
LAANFAGQELRLRPEGPLRFLTDSRIDNATVIEFSRGDDGSIASFTRGGQTFQRVPTDPPPLPASWKRVLGRYGPEFIPVIIHERNGRLYAMTENMLDYRLTPVNAHVLALCPGMYTDEEVVLLTDLDGTVSGIDFANMILPRHR